jgi:hypothetical protein
MNCDIDLKKERVHVRKNVAAAARESNGIGGISLARD